METLSAYPSLAQGDSRAQLHQVIDQIQDEAVLRAALLLLLPQTALEAPEPELSPAWLRRLDQSMQQLDAGQGIPAAEVFARLQQEDKV
ncbi:hypothetical protein A0257_04700 [Hymenobacter psoromatis]|nr:hypothetical protein A0257_04700 [Hymenobacter psoromatis]